MSVVDEVKERIDIVDIVSENVRLRRAGSSYSGFCPFHDNSRTPAFSVFPDSGTWHCFGCGEGGDVFTYLMKREGWDFKETLQYLANRAGIELTPQTPQQAEQQESFARARKLLDEAVLFFQHHLLNTPEGQPARDYLSRRGINDHSIQKFGIGFAPNQWSACKDHFLAQKYSQDELLEVGLITSNEDRQTYYDKFRNRIMFPIRDARGKMTGFGARTLDPDGIPKYLNSPQTELFNKGHLLYGLDTARKAIHDNDQVVIVEGYMDVIIPHQAGFTNTVSPMGTALSAQQLRQIKKLTQHIILALDPDAAGEKATLRGLEIARQTMNREDEIIFDARGLLHQEARLQADIRVCQLPDGLDPDEIILRNPDEWADLLRQAKPIVIHVMDTLLKNQNIEDSKVKGQIAEQVLPLIEDVPNPVEREDYRQRLARLLKVDERSLMFTSTPPLQTGSTTNRRTIQKQQVGTSPKSVDQKQKNITHEIEIHILQLMLKAPEMIHQLDRWLQSFQLERVQPSDFHDINHQMIARVILSALTQDQLDPEDYVQQELSEEQKTILQLSQETMLLLNNYNDRKIKENLIHDFIRLRKSYTEKHLEQLNFMLQDITSTDDQRQLGQTIMQETVHRNKLDKALHKPILFS